MNFIFSEQQVQLQDIARRFCAENSDSARVRAAMASADGFDAAVWMRLAGELGWGGIAVPERYDGLGLGQLEIAIVQQEMGRRLLPSPFLASIGLALPALLAAGNEDQKAQIVPALASGERIAALACTGERGRPGLDGIDAVLSRVAGGGFSLSGSASFVVFGHAADIFVVAARRPGSVGGEGISLLLLPRDTAGLSVEKLATLDSTRPYARLRFDAVAVSADAVLGAPEHAAAAVQRTLAIGAIAIAAEQVGGAERCLEFTTEYAKQREQFGRPIGSFQAVKHKLADMMVLVEAAKSAVYYAACAADEDGAQLLEAAAVAKSFCSDAFSRCAGAAIQLHGGIGITWEHDAHLYFKRARSSSNLLGDVHYQRERIAGGLFDGDQPLLRQLGGQ